MTEGELLHYRHELYRYVESARTQRINAPNSDLEATGAADASAHELDLTSFESAVLDPDGPSGWRVRFVVQRMQDTRAQLEPRWRLVQMGVKRQSEAELSYEEGVFALRDELIPDESFVDVFDAPLVLLARMGECMGPDDNVNTPEELIDAVDDVDDYWRALTDRVERVASLNVPNSLSGLQDAVLAAVLSFVRAISDLIADIARTMDEFEALAPLLEDSDITGGDGPLTYAPVIKLGEVKRQYTSAVQLLKGAL